jgi:hypothetical protein
MAMVVLPLDRLRHRIDRVARSPASLRSSTQSRATALGLENPLNEFGIPNGGVSIRSIRASHNALGGDASPSSVMSCPRNFGRGDVRISRMRDNARSLEARFTWNGLPGAIQVECVANEDPNSLGVWHGVAGGFPVCTAFVDYPLCGYRSMLGWVQLVCSTDNESSGADFEMDPFSLFGDAPSPYCWYGQRPILFDAPSRSVRQPLDWTAHSFLAATPLEEVAALKPRRVVPIIGFSWGFIDTGSEITLQDPTVLAKGAWDSHLGVLRQAYPFWLFSAESDG